MIKKLNSHASLLRKAGLKATPARLKIVAFLQQSKEPVSAQEIITKLKNECDTVTVYRCMNAFKKAGIIRQIDLRQNHAQYEFSDMHHHHHIACTRCGRLEDINDRQLEEILATVAQKTKHFENIKQHSLEFFGICKSCSH